MIGLTPSFATKMSLSIPCPVDALQHDSVESELLPQLQEQYQETLSIVKNPVIPKDDAVNAFVAFMERATKRNRTSSKSPIELDLYPDLVLPESLVPPLGTESFVHSPPLHMGAVLTSQSDPNKPRSPSKSHKRKRGSDEALEAALSADQTAKSKIPENLSKSHKRKRTPEDTIETSLPLNQHAIDDEASEVHGRWKTTFHDREESNDYLGISSSLNGEPSSISMSKCDEVRPDTMDSITRDIAVERNNVQVNESRALKDSMLTVIEKRLASVMKAPR
ncbi:hypothetical protein BJ742DRAFT_55131 [Cladochytrium replicatum]|nr:hypothetical protein BJ742DRAFT_55131 [Cladochytrium replicatum]